MNRWLEVNSSLRFLWSSSRGPRGEWGDCVSQLSRNCGQHYAPKVVDYLSQLVFLFYISKVTSVADWH